MGKVLKLLKGSENGYQRVALENTTCQGCLFSKGKKILT